MVASETDLSKILTIQGLAKLVIPGETVETIAVKISDVHKIDVDKEILGEYCKENLGMSLSKVLYYAKRYNNVDKGAEYRPNSGVSGRRLQGVGPTCKFSKSNGRHSKEWYNHAH